MRDKCCADTMDWIRSSVCTSTDAVHSSITRMFAPFSSARARHLRHGQHRTWRLGGASGEAVVCTCGFVLLGPRRNIRHSDCFALPALASAPMRHCSHQLALPDGERLAALTDLRL